MKTREQCGLDENQAVFEEQVSNAMSTRQFNEAREVKAGLLAK